MMTPSTMMTGPLATLLGSSLHRCCGLLAALGRGCGELDPPGRNAASATRGSVSRHGTLHTWGGPAPEPLGPDILQTYVIFNDPFNISPRTKV